jgi:phospholipase/carboxylesterase
MIDGQVRTFNEWTFRWLDATVKPGKLMLLLHGLSGDENSMWVFTRHFPQDYYCASPRAIFPAVDSGYTWRALDLSRQGSLPAAYELKQAVEAVLKFVDGWSNSVPMEAQQFDVMGFSQGAALTYLLALMHPERVGKFAALSGFIPEGAEEFLNPNSFAGKKIFVAHARQDEMVAVEKARSAVRQLSAVGANVTYCETDGGHKVSKDCMRSLDEFLRSNS